MSGKRFNFAIGAVLFLAIFGSIVWMFRAQNASPGTLGISFEGLETFAVTDRYESIMGGGREVRFVATNPNGDTARVTMRSNQSVDDAKRYRAGQFLLLNTQYDEKLPPYPEFLTNKTGCKFGFLPQHYTTTDGEFYLIHAGERFNYGLCADDLVRYKAGFGIYYCAQSQTVFQIEYFTDKGKQFSDLERVMNSFACT